MKSFGYRAWLQPVAEGTKAQLGFLPKLAGLKGIASEEFVHGLDTRFGKKPSEDGDYTITLELAEKLPPEGYTLRGDLSGLTVSGGSEKGLLYGVYGLLSRLSLGEPVETMNVKEVPAVARRVLNHWDNADGSIERGYAGRSFFFKNGRIGYDLERLKDYARLLASVGINEISVNNVNVYPDSAQLITEEGLPDLAKVAEVFRPFGIRIIVAVHFDSPAILGGLETSDPTVPAVAKYWEDAAKRVYKHIPDLAGFLMKADSEFRSGPAALGLTQDAGANVIAKALEPFGGTIYWRCFIYNCKQDWRDKTIDRPKAAYNEFFPLDGKFAPNVILQVKHGPSDFQVREPNSPLLGAMTQTPQGLEFQISQEYTGQQIDLYATAVQWEEILDTPVTESCMTRDLVGREVTAMVAVSNTGNDDNWTGHLLAQANLYAFGRLAWNPALSAEQLMRDWVALTFGTDPAIVEPIANMLLESRWVYEKYNSPLGLGWMVNISHHYGPSPEGYEYMKWGTYHRATHTAIGVDRTTHGTEYTAQYHHYVRDLYENKKTCPEKLLLFFHRLPYNYKLKSGQTLLQYIYDTHFEGVEDVKRFIATWETLNGKIPQEAYEAVRDRLTRQLENAREWRDVINNYFYRLSGIADEKGRKIYA
ncbi:MAG: alpha-glucuronidase [Defluviitaleaceae bacterium]|nr:alpha-glucuronidase [Defluviitaleaceae bacterium]MCL2274723.1 alpha-glucuronidase [Defluviitaleaceae bacterium]